MTRSVKTAVSMAGIFLGVIIASVAAYYIGASFGGSLIAGQTKITLKTWEDAYNSLVILMGVFSLIIALIYYGTLRFISKISYPFGAGKRLFWGILLAVVFAISIILPYIYAGINDNIFRADFSIPALFMLIYGVIYFWVGSIFVTPDAYKYTPIGASVLRK